MTWNEPQESKFEIVCPYCRKPYTARMEHCLYEAAGCDTCGGRVEGEIEIYCENCNKLVYKKEL